MLTLIKKAAGGLDTTTATADNATQIIALTTRIKGVILRCAVWHPAMVSHLSKYRKLIPALALVFALIDTPDSGGVIHEPELLRVLAWEDHLRPHANRLYAAAVTPETTDAATLLSRIKAGKLVDRNGVILDNFTPRQVALKHWPDWVHRTRCVRRQTCWQITTGCGARLSPTARQAVDRASATPSIQ